MANETKSRSKPRLEKRYHEEIVPALMKELGYKNPMRVPRLKVISLNMGLGEAVANPNLVKAGVAELSTIAGQRAVATRSKKSIANFKLREGLPIGARVTLRGRRMWEFLDRLIAVALPRTRDFRGINGNAMDGHGNYTLGVREQLIFQEVDYEKIEKVLGFNVTFGTSTDSDTEGKLLLKQLGMPFKN